MGEVGARVPWCVGSLGMRSRTRPRQERSSRGPRDGPEAPRLGAGCIGCLTSDGSRPPARTAGTRSKGRKTQSTPPRLGPTACSADTKDVVRQARRRGVGTGPEGVWPTRAPRGQAWSAEGKPRQQAAAAAEPVPLVPLPGRGRPAPALGCMATADGAELMVMRPRRSNDLVPSAVRTSVEASLRRLRRETVDVLHIHNRFTPRRGDLPHSLSADDALGPVLDAYQTPTTRCTTRGRRASLASQPWSLMCPPCGAS